MSLLETTTTPQSVYYLKVNLDRVPMRLTLLHKGLILVSIPLCFEIGVFSLLINLQNQADTEAQKVSHNKEINDDVNNILRQAMFLGSSKTKTFNNVGFNDHANQILVNFQDLESLTSDNPALSQSLARCKTSMLRAQGKLQFMQNAIRTGMNPKSSQITEARLGLYNDFQQAINDGLLDLATQSSHEADDTHSRELRESIKLLLQGALFISLLMGVLGATLFSKQLVGRLEKLKINAANLANGAPLLPPDKGDDEVAELDESFHAAATAIAEATRMRQEATAMITHDLKTPLQSIRSFLEMLSHGMLADLSAEGRVMMKQSDDETAKMVGLIDSVLQLEKMRSGSIKLKFSKVNVAELLVDSMDSVKPLARERAVILKCEYAGLENETIEADASWMEQVLVNVLLNSIKLSPEHQSVLIVLQSRADEVSISISDKGVGIPRSEHKLVFEKFHQLSNESSIGAGSGLGLAISKQLVELHHGEIKLTEADGRGNKFVITLPKSQAVPSKSSSESVKD